MKKLYLTCLLISCFTIASRAQLSPLESSEICPGTPINFTYLVTGEFIAASISNLVHTSLLGPPTVVYSTQTGKTTISFTIQFADQNTSAQSFRINKTPKTGTASFTDHSFTKVKSLLVSLPIAGLPASVNVPVCSTNPFAFTFTATKWVYAFPNPPVQFGTVTDYDYILPAGWVMNFQTSNGSTPIRGSANVTITPHAFTGGDIKVAPANYCALPNTLIGGNFQSVPIAGRQPISLVANGHSTIKFFCGDLTPQVFTLQNANLAGCISGYTWNLGSNNGWIYNGNPAPASIVTATNTITLTPACNITVPPSNVSVTTSGAAGTFNIAIEKIVPAVEIAGDLGLCQSAVYSIPAPCGSTVSWSATPANIISLAPNGNQVTVSKSSSSGTAQLKATITGSCGDVYVYSKYVEVGSDLFVVDYRISNNPPTYIVQFPTNSTQAILNVPAGGYQVSAFSHLTTPYTINWTLVPGGNGYTGWTTNSSNGTAYSSWNFAPSGSTATVPMKLTTVSGACSLDLHLIFIKPPGMMFRVGPNPASGSLSISKEDGVKESPVSYVRIFDITGRVRKVMKVNQSAPLLVPVDELPEGFYIVEITSGKNIERKKIKIAR